MTNIATIIKLYIAVKGMSQTELAKEMGLTKPTLSRFLQGHDINVRHFGLVLAWLTREAV